MHYIIQNQLAGKSLGYMLGFGIYCLALIGIIFLGSYLYDKFKRL